MLMPPGFNTFTPYFFVKDAPAFIDFLTQAFGGVELLRHVDGERIANAQVRLGSSTVMVSEATPAFPPMPGCFYLYVDDAESAMARAVATGAVEIMPVQDMPY